MPLHLIYGPPNSGRAGVVMERFLAALARDPLLVVPTLDDVFSFERELCERHGALAGGSIVVFDALFREVAKACGEHLPATLTAAQRLRLLQAAVQRTELGPLRGSAARPGFAAALGDLVSELQSAGLDPDAVAAGAGTLEASAYLGALTSLYRSYAQARDSIGAVDSHQAAAGAIAGLRRDPDAWRGRPVFLYGFDDLTPEQLELVAALSGAAEVTASITYEDRPALTARARLLQSLRDLGAASETATEPDPANTESELLFRLERSFLGDGGEGSLVPDESLVLLRSGGDRPEAELVGAEIARLLAAGAEPDEIAIALRDPARRGRLFARVLRGFGIPVALEAEAPVADSGTGTCVLALLRAAFDSRSAADLLLYLRGPRRAPPGAVDRLERQIRTRRLRSAGEAAAEWERAQGPLRELGRLREREGDPQSLLAEVAALARDVAQWPLARPETQGEIPDHDAAHELRVGERIAAAAEELAELEGLEPSPPELIATLQGLRMRAWTGPAEGRVRIASPYELRATRVRHLFACSLQDGEFPRHDSPGPFLSDEQRHALGLPERADVEEEERYLFHVCLSRPTERLYLSHRSSDETGAAEPRSPFLDEVRRLLSPPPPEDPGEPDPVAEQLTCARGLGDVVFAPALAPSEDELARSLGVAGLDPGDPALALDAERAAAIAGRLDDARRRCEAADAPGPLRSPAVIAALGGVGAYGGTTLETFDVCSYRWFVQHELAPKPLDPTPEPLYQGLLMHSALERLYREAPGEDSLPRPGDLGRWIARGREIVDEVTAELSEHPADLAMRRRLERLVVAFLRREAARENPRLRPALLEAGFGDEEGTEQPQLEIDGWALHGRIDRVDVGGGAAVAYDYKLAREVTPFAKFLEEGKLQLPLYLLALRELWQLDVIGGVYQPLRPTTKPRPRGLLRKDDAEELLGDLGLYEKDLLEADDFEAALEDAAARATRAVTRMRAGDIERDPGPPAGVKGHGQCPKFCGYAPICRRERAPFQIPEDELEEELT